MKAIVYSVSALASLALCSAALPSCAGATLIGGARWGLFEIDLTTGLTTPIALSSGQNIKPLNGLDYNSRDGFLYATTAPDSRLFTPRPGPWQYGYYRIDIRNRSFEALPFTGEIPDYTLDGLAYDSIRDIFWGTNLYTFELVTLNPYSGEVNVVGRFPELGVISGLAFDAVTDTLYGVDDYDYYENDGFSRLVTIDRSTLQLTTIGQPGLGLGLGDLDALAFDPRQRVLYTRLDQEQPYGQLIRIDPTTGIAVAVGIPNNGYHLYHGLAFLVPEPGALALISLALVSLIRQKRSMDA